MAVQLDRHHPGPGLGQRQGQRAQPGPELEHRGAGPDVGQAGDAPDRVGISDEVLAERPAGAKPMCGEQRRDVSAGMGHQEIVTSTTPSLGSANCAKPDGDMSTTRGYPACSRSSTVHVVLAPVATFVTVKTVPNGSVGLAHIPGGAAAYHVAWPRSLVVPS